MATKKITDLQLISAVTSGLNFPSDDGIQSYRATANQIKAFILANENITLAMLALNIFNGLTAVTPASDDYIPIVDTSDSNKTKKALLNSFAFQATRTITNPSDTAILTSDSTIKIAGTTGAIVLPTAVGLDGKRYKIIHAGSNFVKYPIKTTSAQTVGGIASGDYKLCTAGEVLEVESDGANWIIMGRVTDTDWVNAGVISIASTGTQPAKGSVQSHDKFWWRRRGPNAQVRMNFRQTNATGSTTGTGDYLFDVSSYLGSIDTAKLDVYATAEGWNSSYLNAFTVGTSEFGGDGGNNNGTGNVVVYDAQYVRIFGQIASGAGGTPGQSGFGLGNTNQFYSLNFEVPIVDWRP